MDHQSLLNILGVFRLLKATNTGHSAVTIVRQMVQTTERDSEVLKIASHIVEQGCLAKTVIENSKLDPEAKSGVVAAIDQVINAFSVEGMNSAWSSHVRNVEGGISNLVILLSAMQLPTASEPPELGKLLADIAEMVELFETTSLDPAVRDVGLRHILILQTLLTNIVLFGAEAALTTYFELIMKLRRTDAGASNAAQRSFDPLFDKIKEWGPSLYEIDKAMNNKARLVADLSKPMDVLEYVPRE